MINEVIIPRHLYSEHFKPVLNSRHRYVVCLGGRGAAKTFHIILKLLLITFRSNHVSVYYCRKNYETLRKNTFKDFQYVMKLAKIAHNFEFSTAYNSSMVIKNKITGNSIQPYGLLDSENTKGISEATHIFVDEITENNKESIDMIDSVLRTPQAEYLQFICAFNPVDENNFIRKYFFDENNPYKGRADYGDDLLVHHSTLEDNEYLDKEAYKLSLQRKYGHNKNLLDVNLHGLWGKAEVDNPFIFNFAKERHVKKFEQVASVYHLSFDFNVSPMTCLVAEVQKNKKLKIIKEFRDINSNTHKLCEIIKNWLPFGAILRVTGDATGNNKSSYTSGNVGQYDTISKILKVPIIRIDTPSINIGHVNSRDQLNMMFHRDMIEIHESCTYLIEDIEYLECLPDGKIDKKKDENIGHLMDCLRYLASTYFELFK